MPPIHNPKTAFIHTNAVSCDSQVAPTSRYWRNLKRRKAAAKADEQVIPQPTVVTIARHPKRRGTPRQLLHRWLPRSLHLDADVLARLIRIIPGTLPSVQGGAPDTDCWVVRSADVLFAYPVLRLRDGVLVTAHLWLYAAIFGGIPEFFVVDHLCEVKACCNPDHLEAVTVAENVCRSKARKAARVP